MKEKKKILFVCLGNICRSSSAEGVMRHLIEEAGREDEFVIDSAGILSYHQGELPDSRMRAHAARRGYNLRKVNFDFAREQTFTHVMELLDKDYRYRLFYIGRVSRKKLNEIAERLQQAGVDATCSLNDNKRFYHDNRH